MSNIKLSLVAIWLSKFWRVAVNSRTACTGSIAFFRLPKHCQQFDVAAAELFNLTLLRG